MTECLMTAAGLRRAEKAAARKEERRYCPHPLHAERPEGRVRLRSYKSALDHFCDACALEGRVLDLAFGATGGWRWWG